MNLIDNVTNKKLNAVMQGIVGKDFICTHVEKEWQKKHECLENLTNQNKSELHKMNLKLLKGLKFKDIDCQLQWNILKLSTNISPQQKEFAKFIYDNYTKHSLKAQGFD